jgi:hypothetical protein
MGVHRRQAKIVGDAHVDAHADADAQRHRREQQEFDVQSCHLPLPLRLCRAA